MKEVKYKLPPAFDLENMTTGGNSNPMKFLTYIKQRRKERNEYVKEKMNADGIVETHKILESLSDIDLLALLFNALRTNTADENEKVKVAEFIMNRTIPDQFQFIGAGTNRASFMKDNYIFKVALDRRGVVDNLTEFKRGQEVSNFVAEPYETNMLILVSEYVTLMTKEEFRTNKQQIKKILDRLSEYYIFADMGLTEKNYANWGYRTDRRTGRDQIVCLDYGYMYPLFGNEDILTCPFCGNRLVYNNSYTQLICSDAANEYHHVSCCGKKFEPEEIIMQNLSAFEEYENEKIKEEIGLELPDFDQLSQVLYQ